MGNIIIIAFGIIWLVTFLIINRECLFKTNTKVDEPLSYEAYSDFISSLAGKAVIDIALKNQYKDWLTSKNWPIIEYLLYSNYSIFI